MGSLRSRIGFGAGGARACALGSPWWAACCSPVLTLYITPVIYVLRAAAGLAPQGKRKTEAPADASTAEARSLAYSAISRPSPSACARRSMPSSTWKSPGAPARQGSIVVKKAYCDWDRYKEFKVAMHAASFELIEIPHVRSRARTRRYPHVVDALDLCYTKNTSTPSSS